MHEKITKSKNATVAGIRQLPVAVAGFWRTCLAESGYFRSESGPPASREDGRKSPEFGAVSIPVAGCCRIPAPPGFRQPIIAGFLQSDIKHAYKDQEFNFGKRFTVFKTINRFPKIKKVFTVKPKMIFVDHYFRPYQTS
jgi:hypothetical protein